MAAALDQLLALVARWHAGKVAAQFRRQLDQPRAAQLRALRAALQVTAGSQFARDHKLASVRDADDLRRALPLQRYEDYQPYIDRLAAGQRDALHAPGRRVVMFATSSGTTARRKLIPVTREFVADYRRGWNIFGLKMLSDHPAAFLRHILQSSGRFDESYTPAGIPCGAITGLLALTQKRIVRRFYIGRPEIAAIDDVAARYYTLMRCAVVHDVAFAITANPATLLQLARIADQESETLIRDVHDGGLSPRIAPLLDSSALRNLRLRPDPQRARALQSCRAKAGRLRPRDYWRLEFLACWTGASMAQYLPRLVEWYGEIPVRDVGLLASEGRVSIPIDDGSPAGVLDVGAGFFEFIPVENFDQPNPETILAHELEPGREYAVVLTNRSGLLRYRLDDVIRVGPSLGRTPLVEFLYRGGRVASVAGEKLTENQMAAAVSSACARLGIAPFDFVAAPIWSDPPFYRLTGSAPELDGLSELIDVELGQQNSEYSSRRKSMRLGPLTIRRVDSAVLAALDARQLAMRGSASEQFKRQCLFTRPGDDEAALAGS